MTKAENIIIKDKYKGLKNLVLICGAMDEFAKIYHAEQCVINDVSNWVAVEEKLPPKYENVIIRNENNIVSTDQISDNGWVFEEISKVKVTHWQPMPEPPCC